ncbi:MAG: glycosyltransferase 87 family protein [Thermoanaerobaculia bacterium]
MAPGGAAGWVWALPVVGVHIALWWLGDLGARLGSALVVWSLGLVWLAVIVRRRRGGPCVAPVVVLAVAALSRLLLVPLAPTLSDDVRRYLWDGRVAAAGRDPYVLAPDAPELADLRDAEWEEVAHRDIATVYPPLAVTLFSIAARLPHPLLSWKLLLVVVDWTTCLLLVRLATRHGLPVERTIWYAWNPLVTTEVAGMGHVDALGVAAAVATVLLLEKRGRPVLAPVAAAGAAVLAKLVPVVAVPWWARASGSPRRFAAGVAGLVTIGLAPVVWHAGGVPPGLRTYAVSWEFDGPLFEPLWRLLDHSGAAGLVHALLDHLKLWTGAHEFWNAWYPWAYPQLLAKILLLLGFAAVCVHGWRRRREPIAASGWVFGSVLLFSATVYPWYLLWVLPWAALALHEAWLALSGLVLLSYLPRHAGLELFPAVYGAIWLPFASIWLLRRSQWSIG